jgi:type II secretory pathway pseudopilin PulG
MTTPPNPNPTAIVTMPPNPNPNPNPTAIVTMPPSPNPAPTPLRDEHGFTLVEMLVAMVTGMVVILATLSILDISISQSSRISERVDADQRGRLAMEKILLELHSSCTFASANPVEPESSDKVLKFVSQTGTEAYFTKMVKHLITFNPEAGTLTDANYVSNNELKAGETTNEWTYPNTPTSTQTLLTGVSQSKEKTTETPIPVFQYFKYEGGSLSSTPLTIPLSLTDAGKTVEVTVSFRAAPSSIGYHASKGTEGDRAVDLSNSVVLRFDPSSAAGGNEPCE